MYYRRMTIFGTLAPIALALTAWFALSIPTALIIGAMITRRNAEKPHNVDFDRLAREFYETQEHTPRS